MTQPSFTPAEIDLHAKQYLELQGKLDALEKARVEIKNQLELKADYLKDLVLKLGGSHAEKSKIIFGVDYELMCTKSQYTWIDSAAVETFRDALRKSKQARLLNKVFEKTIRWNLKSEASDIVRGSKLTTKLQALWAKCIVLKDRNPSLTVRAKEKAA